MRSLLYIRLLAEGQTINYSNPILELVKNQFPDAGLLDIDSQSGELVLHYARQMLQDSERVAIVLDSTTTDAGFGKVFPLIELLLGGGKEQLILFRNDHNRLLRMVKARPELYIKQVQSDEELVQEIAAFYSSG
jgi:hypothetical protein